MRFLALLYFAILLSLFSKPSFAGSAYDAFTFEDAARIFISSLRQVSELQNMSQQYLGKPFNTTAELMQMIGKASAKDAGEASQLKNRIADIAKLYLNTRDAYSKSPLVVVSDGQFVEGPGESGFSEKTKLKNIFGYWLQVRSQDWEDQARKEINDFLYVRSTPPISVPNKSLKSRTELGTSWRPLNSREQDLSPIRTVAFLRRTMLELTLPTSEIKTAFILVASEDESEIEGGLWSLFFRGHSREELLHDGEAIQKGIAAQAQSLGIEWDRDNKFEIFEATNSEAFYSTLPLEEGGFILRYYLPKSRSPQRLTTVLTFLNQTLKMKILDPNAIPALNQRFASTVAQKNAKEEQFKQAQKEFKPVAYLETVNASNIEKIVDVLLDPNTPNHMPFVLKYAPWEGEQTRRLFVINRVTTGPYKGKYLLLFHTQKRSEKEPFVDEVMLLTRGKDNGVYPTRIRKDVTYKTHLLLGELPRFIQNLPADVITDTNEIKVWPGPGERVHMFFLNDSNRAKAIQIFSALAKEGNLSVLKNSHHFPELGCKAPLE